MNSVEFDLVEFFVRRHLPGICLHFHGRFPVAIMQELLNSIFGVRELDVERSRMKMPIEIMPVHVNLEGDVQRVLILPKMIFKLTGLDS